MEPLMQTQINSFAALMAEKGYTDFFSSIAELGKNSNVIKYTGNLEGALKDSVNWAAFFKKPHLLFPFNISTWWRNEKEECTSCDWILDHNAADGFSIQKMEIRHRNNSGVDLTPPKVIHPKSLLAVPTKEEAMALIALQSRKQTRAHRTKPKL